MGERACPVRHRAHRAKSTKGSSGLRAADVACSLMLGDLVAGRYAPDEDARMERPETRFAWNGDVALAYQVLGVGSPDLLFAQGFASNVELNRELPAMSRFLGRLSQRRRLIVMDPRGLGRSERGTPRDVPLLEIMMDDLAAVLDRVGSEQAVILATQEMCFVACLFAATYPDRTRGRSSTRPRRTTSGRRRRPGSGRAPGGTRRRSIPLPVGDARGRTGRPPRGRTFGGR